MLKTSYPLFVWALLAMNPNSINQNNKDSKLSGTDSSDNNNDINVVKVTALYRYAVKGFGGDSLTSVDISQAGETFPDDRRFALLKSSSSSHEDEKLFDPNNPKWLHKENFLCSFTNPKLMAMFNCEYKIFHPLEDDVDRFGNDKSKGPSTSIAHPLDQTLVPEDYENNSNQQQRWFTLWRRDKWGIDQSENNQLISTSRTNDDSGDDTILKVDLQTSKGREKLGIFFSDVSNQNLVCVCASNDDKVEETQTDGVNNKGNIRLTNAHSHQFGNTRSGVSARNDTRTVHIVNAATVREVSQKFGIKLNPERFRPNIVIDGLEPWEEFDWVENTLKIVPTSNSDDSGIHLDVIKRTVRCAGIGLDPNDPDTTEEIDIPKLLQKHFPQYGPYLGVYAVISKDGHISLGDKLELL